MSNSAFQPTIQQSLPNASTSNAGLITIKQPTQTRYTSGSGTYTVPAGVVWLKVRMVGGGGGGAGGPSGGSGGTGGNTTFGTSFLVADGAIGGNASNGWGGTGGTASIGAGATRTISRQDFSAGQTDVPGNPKYFIKWNQTAPGSGGGFNTLQQRIEDVTSLSGRTVTVSFWAKAASSTSVGINFDQNFGTGGSTFNPQPGGSVTIGTTWQRYSVTYTFQSVSGKTIGANNFCAIAFLFPNNATSNVDIANVQLEEGVAPTPFEIRPIGLELSLCQRYYCRGGAGQPGLFTGANIARFSFRFPVEMRIAPTVTAFTAPNAYIGAVAETQTGSQTSAFDNAPAGFAVTTLAHSKVQMGGFTGGVDGRGSILLNDCLQASAEL